MVDWFVVLEIEIVVEKNLLVINVLMVVVVDWLNHRMIVELDYSQLEIVVVMIVVDLLREKMYPDQHLNHIDVFYGYLNTNYHYIYCYLMNNHHYICCYLMNNQHYIYCYLMNNHHYIYCYLMNNPCYSF
jgi:hypothetical protein